MYRMSKVMRSVCYRRMCISVVEGFEVGKENLKLLSKRLYLPTAKDAKVEFQNAFVLFSEKKISGVTALHRRFLSTNPDDKPNPKGGHGKDIEQVLDKLKFEHGSEPNVDILMRTLAVTIIDLQMERHDREVAENNLNEARQDAAVFEFLLISRKELEVIAKYAKGCPDVEKFTAAMQKLPEFANIDAAMLSGGKHFRNLLWMLATLNPYVSKQVEVLRNLLHRDPERYIWFANQGQHLYDFFSSDVHDEGRLLNVKYIEKKLIPIYVKFLPIDLKEAMLLFWNTME